MVDYLPVEDDSPVAVFDLDGCLIVSPASSTIKDPDYWRKHFSCESHRCNPEIVRLARSLMYAHWKIVVLTARPEEYRDVTTRWLIRMLGPTFTLHMFDGQYESANGWKAQQVQSMIDSGLKVQFVVEDYKPNAEAIRKVVPVLLYEARRY